MEDEAFSKEEGLEFSKKCSDISNKILKHEIKSDKDLIREIKNVLTDKELIISAHQLITKGVGTILDRKLQEHQNNSTMYG